MTKRAIQKAVDIDEPHKARKSARNIARVQEKNMRQTKCMTGISKSNVCAFWNVVTWKNYIPGIVYTLNEYDKDRKVGFANDTW